MADALSEVLRAVRLTGGVFLDAEFTAPWRVTAQIGADDCRAFGISHERVIGVHYVFEGECLVEVDGEQAVALRAGDLVLLARNDPHRLGSDLACPVVRGDELIQPGPDGRLATIRYGGGGPRTRIVCGYLASAGENPLSASLPRVLTLRSREGSARDWVESSFRFAATELAAGRPGSDMVLAKLSELLFVEAVRVCIARLPPDRTGWLAGLRDPQIARALALLHERVAHPWTVDELARSIGVSRSVLGERFAALLGEPPMRYLTRWRMQLAARRLLEGHEALARIAAEVGYDSEAAFNRAFKRELGIPPATWRKNGGQAPVDAGALGLAAQ
jgi:AraC-like DNA-binding protein